MLTDIVFMFEVHQPYRLNRDAYRLLLEKVVSRGEIEYSELEDILFDQGLNKLVIERASEKCYIPASKIILENILRFRESDRKFKVSYSISGVFLEQALRWKPEVIDLFIKLVETGCVELVEQTYYHSLAAFMPISDWGELREQLHEHNKIIMEIFNYKPSSIENTEFTYNNDLACFFHSLGYRVVLTEGVDWILGWRSPNYIYRAYGCDIRVLTRNYRLSDDIGYRFSDRGWDQYPLTADKYSAWLASTPGDLIFIAIDYETFGEHHWPETGIYEFLKWLPGEILKYSHLSFSTPSEVIEKYPVRDVYDVPPWSSISWADERDLSAWLGNAMQWNAFNILVELRPYVRALENPEINRLWKLLTISDHLYYVATKFGSIEQVHSYFSPYKSAPEAYAIYVEALTILATIISEEISRNRWKIVKNLKLPSHKAFHFHNMDGSYTGFSAHSIPEMMELIDKIPLQSLIYHLKRGDIQAWLRNIYGLEETAIEIDILLESIGVGEEIREKLKKIINQVLNME